MSERAQAAKSGHASFIRLESSESDGVSILRKQAVLGELPLKVARAVAITMSWDNEVRVPVMVLNHSEYPGSQYRSPANIPETALDPGALRLGGKAVYDYLCGAGMSPSLGYLYDGMTRTYTLQIFITVKIS